jgi:hypothetical protein
MLKDCLATGKYPGKQFLLHKYAIRQKNFPECRRSLLKYYLDRVLSGSDYGLLPACFGAASGNKRTLSEARPKHSRSRPFLNRVKSLIPDEKRGFFVDIHSKKGQNQNFS